MDIVSTNRLKGNRAGQLSPTKTRTAPSEPTEQSSVSDNSHLREDVVGFAVVTTVMGTGLGSIIGKALEAVSPLQGAGIGFAAGAVLGPIIGHYAHHNF